MRHLDHRGWVAALAVLGLLSLGLAEARADPRPAPRPLAAAPAPSDRLQGQIEALQAEIKALQDEIRALDVQLKQAAEDLDRLRRNKPVPPKSGASKEEQDKYSHALSSWQASVDAAQKKVDTLKSQIEGKRMQLQVKRMQLEKLQRAGSGRRPGATPGQ